MLAPAPKPPSLFKRLAAGLSSVLPPPRATPMREMGVSGTPVWGGYVQVRERSPQWTGRQRYTTIADMAVNTSIIAAGVHYFVNLVAHPQWTVAPADESAEAKAVAEFIEECLYDLTTPWPAVVRKTSTYRFYGFGVQEWTAKRRPDGRIGLSSVEPRPQHSIEQWAVADDGTVEGVWQRDPRTGALLGIPRSKFVYLVDDVLTDSPEGTGLFRHLAEPWERLEAYYALETRAFERDLRGTPVGRVPYTALRAAVSSGEITQAQADTLAQAMENFVKLQIKQSDTAITLDSQPYYSQAADGAKVAGVQQWGLELLTGGASGMTEVGAAIVRTQHEMARILTAEHLMMGESSGNRALSQDKSRNLYLVANAVLGDIAACVTRDLVAPLCLLNGVAEDMYPRCEVEDVAFKDAEAVAATLAKMAQAGAVLAPDDPVIEDVRGLMGVSPPTPIPPELIGLGPKPGEVEGEEEEDEDKDLEKAEDQPRVPAGSSQGGQFASVGGGGGGGIVHVSGNIVSMPPSKYLALAMPFGVSGGPELGEAIVERYMRDAGERPLLTVKENSGGVLQVGLHDGRHRATAAERRGDASIEVQIIRGRKFAREHPKVTDAQLAERVVREGLLAEHHGLDLGKTFNPNQPRAPDGKWTSGGGGGAGVSSNGAATALLAQRRDADASLESVTASLTPQQREMMAAAREAVATGKSTRSQFLQADGTYTPEREALHEEILGQMFSAEAVAAATPPEGTRPELVMTGGRPAAGKTSSLRSGGVDAGPPKYIYLSADTIQESLPGYSGPRAGLFNPEAQDIADKAEGVARQLGVNLTFDATMKTGKSAVDRVTRFQEAGYDVSGYFVHTSPAISALRSVQRFAETGRFVPPEVSLNSLTNESTFDSLTPKFKRWMLFDNNGSAPRVVAQGGK